VKGGQKAPLQLCQTKLTTKKMYGFVGLCQGRLARSMDPNNNLVLKHGEQLVPVGGLALESRVELATLLALLPASDGINPPSVAACAKFPIVQL